MKPPKKGINFTQHKDKENKIFITGWRVAETADLQQGHVDQRHVWRVHRRRGHHGLLRGHPGGQAGVCSAVGKNEMVLKDVRR